MGRPDYSPAVPAPWRRVGFVVARNFRVYLKLLLPSLAALLIDPVVALFGIGLGIGSLVGDIGGMSYVTFIASGMAAYSAVMAASFEALYSAFTRMHVQKTWQSILCAPMRLSDVFLGELLWAALKAVISSMALVAVVVMLGFLPATALIYVLPAVALGAVALSSLALCFNAVANSYDFFSYYFSLFLTPMAMLSGLFFPREVLPAPLYYLSEYLPLTQLLYLVRPLALGEAPEHVLGPLLYFPATAALFGYVAYRLTRRRLVR